MWGKKLLTWRKGKGEGMGGGRGRGGVSEGGGWNGGGEGMGREGGGGMGREGGRKGGGKEGGGEGEVGTDGVVSTTSIKSLIVIDLFWSHADLYFPALYTGLYLFPPETQSDFHIGCMLNLTIMCQGGDALYSDGSKILKRWPAPDFDRELGPLRGDRFESPSVEISEG